MSDISSSKNHHRARIWGNFAISLFSARKAVPSGKVLLFKGYSLTRLEIVIRPTVVSTKHYQFPSFGRNSGEDVLLRRDRPPNDDNLQYWLSGEDEYDEEDNNEAGVKEALVKAEYAQIREIRADTLFWDHHGLGNDTSVDPHDGALIAVQEAQGFLNQLVGGLVATEDTKGAIQLLEQLEGFRALKGLDRH